MPEPRIFSSRHLIGSALAGCRYATWVAALSDRENGVVEVICEKPGNSEELERIVRAEHNSLLHEGGGVLITRSRCDLAPYTHGVTLVCRGNGGPRLLVTVLRTSEQGRFTGADLAFLELSASTIATRVEPYFGTAAATDANIRSRDQPAFFVLSLQPEILFSWIPPSMRHAESAFGDLHRLRAMVLAAARELTVSWRPDDPSTHQPGMAVPHPSVVIRTMPLVGAAGLQIGATAELLRKRDTIGAAARAFRFSPRELDVLALLLEGLGTREVAKILHIAPSTATDHVKRMLVKTNSRNRAELIAQTLGWRNGYHQNAVAARVQPTPIRPGDQTPAASASSAEPAPATDAV